MSITSQSHHKVLDRFLAAAYLVFKNGTTSMSSRLAFFTLALATTVVTIALLHNLGYVSFSERPGFTHVCGHVSYNGKPVPGCAIYFQPQDPNSSHWGVGRLSDSGLYFITAYQLESTLAPGRYTIFVRPLTPGPPGPAQYRYDPDKPLSNQAPDKSSPSSSSTPQLPLPIRFTDSRTSGLVVNITGEPQRIEIHLRD
jgi:hypothetical protein